MEHRCARSGDREGRYRHTEEREETQSTTKAQRHEDRQERRRKRRREEKKGRRRVATRRRTTLDSRPRATRFRRARPATHECTVDHGADATRHGKGVRGIRCMRHLLINTKTARGLISGRPRERPRAQSTPHEPPPIDSLLGRYRSNWSTNFSAIFGTNLPALRWIPRRLPFALIDGGARPLEASCERRLERGLANRLSSRGTELVFCTALPIKQST